MKRMVYWCDGCNVQLSADLCGNASICVESSGDFDVWKVAIDVEHLCMRCRKELIAAVENALDWREGVVRR